MRGLILIVASVTFVSCAQGPNEGLGSSAAVLPTGTTGVSTTRAAGDVQLGPIEILRVRLRPLSGTPSGFYAGPGGSYRILPGAATELWVEWSSSAPLPAPPRLVVDWGDGSSDNIHCGPCRFEHTYKAGEYVVSVLLDDRTGGTTRRTFNLSAREADSSNAVPVTRVFSNPASIFIPYAGGCTESAAVPYPAPITVTGMTGTITKVTVTFRGFSTQNLDLLALLVAPNGGTVKLLDEAGGTPPITNADLTFDDSAPSCCSSVGPGPATRQPSTSGNDSPMLPPAPNVVDALTLSALNGSSANGTWQLFLQSHLVCFDAQSALTGGWSLTITSVEN